MKKLFFVLVIFALLLVACGKKEEAQIPETPVDEVVTTVSMNFKVLGESETAKKLIEAAALSVKGVTEANWNMDKKTINLKGTQEVVWEDVHSAIAGAGFDTDIMKATKEAFNNLPEEAKYMRERNATLRDEEQTNSNKKNKTEAKSSNGRRKATRQKAE